MAGQTNAERAQVARINRLLAPKGDALCRMRSDSRWAAEYGPYYIIDVSTAGIGARGIHDLDALERELRHAAAAARREQLATLLTATTPPAATEGIQP